MRQPLRRRRRGKDQDSDDARSDVEPADAPDPVDSVWEQLPVEEPAVAGDLDTGGLLGDDVMGPSVESDDAAKQAAYAAWADRMKTHKKSKLADLVADSEEAEGKRPTTSPYWDTAALYSTAPDENPTDPSLMATSDLLSVLELPRDAASADLQGAFRRLAKEHHPDRWHDAPSDVRAEHEARMALITEAHRELRRRDL